MLLRATAQWIDAIVRALRALFLRGERPSVAEARPFDPPLGPAQPLHANSVEHGDQHGPRPVPRPAGPPPPPAPPGAAA